MIMANETRQKRGLDACTSKQCVWLPPAQDVGLDSLFIIENGITNIQS